MTGATLRSERLWLAAAFLFAVAVIFLYLGSDGMYAPQEGRTAIITRNMLVSGNWIDMNAGLGIPYEKPVGHYWLCLPFAKLFGLDAPEPLRVPAEWALRLPSALSALLAVAVSALLAARIYGLRTAAVTMVILSSMMTFCHLARLAHIDMPLAAAFVCAMYFLYTGYLADGRCNRRIYGFYLFLGWGVLLKGPLILILAGLAALALMCWSRRWTMLWELRPLTGVLLVLLVALPWYVAETVRTNGDFFREFIINQNFRRFTGIGSTYQGGKFMPLWYYVPKLFAGALPWSLAAVAAAAYGFKRLIRLRFREGTVFLLLWFLTGFVFFSLSALKRGDYLLPLYPALAILTAHAVVTGCRRMPELNRRWLWAWGILAALTVLLLAVNYSGVLIKLGDLIASRTIPHISRRDGMNLVMFSRFVNAHFLAAAAAAAGVLAILFSAGYLLERQRPFAAFWAIALSVFLAFAGYYSVLQPATDHLKTVKGFVRKALPLIPPGTEVAYVGDFNTEMIFFMNRPYKLTPGRETGFVIASPASAASLQNSAPGRWRELCRTPPRHQYPAVLLQRVEKRPDPAPAAR